jgi:crotonobetainyl-CoA:carnitine CoA-transferase CaiB-like acyl-CoA transferase
VIQAFDENQWRALRAVASPALDGFHDLEDRLACLEALDGALTDWCNRQDGRALMHRLQAVGVPAAVTHSAAGVLADEHLQARGFWQYLERAVVGLQPNPSAPYRVGARPIEVAAPAPTLGQHNQEVLGGILGLSQGDLERLTGLGVIGTKPRMRKTAR